MFLKIKHFGYPPESYFGFSSKGAKLVILEHSELEKCQIYIIFMFFGGGTVFWGVCLMPAYHVGVCLLSAHHTWVSQLLWHEVWVTLNEYFWFYDVWELKCSAKDRVFKVQISHFCIFHHFREQNSFFMCFL